MSSKRRRVEDAGESKDDAEVLSVRWNSDRYCVTLLDQKALPVKVQMVDCDTAESVAHHIKLMTVRGAPAIGAAGAYGMVLAVTKSDGSDVLQSLKDAKEVLDAARPTAVNLSWATGRMLDLGAKLVTRNASFDKIQEILLLEACELANDDVLTNCRLGEHGTAIVPQEANILHHCNTGNLATVSHGTALGIIYSSHAHGKKLHVWVDETRPRLQGARLSAWEIMRAGIDMHLIADSASGHLMRAGRVDVVLFGADRVAANGDVANKIGSYNLAVVARENGVPVYAAVPTSTIDLSIESGSSIPIEERSAEEITHIRSVQIAPDNVPVYNPAFDVTPHRYITGIVTEHGICYPPYTVSLAKAVAAAKEQREQQLATRLERYFADE